ncbi:MAG: PRC-barrel domain-containing protein [Methanolobus sp.]|nr:PRC-barrel domain-containing protein [Methanolobus sp.]
MSNTEMLSVETIKRDPIKDESGNEIGTFIDFMIDIHRNGIPYVIISLKDRDGYVGVPWEIFNKGDGHYFIPDIEISKLKDAPGFPEDDWPDMKNREFAKSVYEHFECTLYW